MLSSKPTMDLAYPVSVVIDNGTGFIKAGFSGDDYPKHTISNVVGYPKFQNIMIGTANKVVNSTAYAILGQEKIGKININFN